MGKKGGKKSEGKKKGGKKKKNDEPEMTWKEALLAYQIHIKQRQMEDVKYELRAVEDMNNRNKERNERLKSEQVLYMKELLKQAKEFENQLAKEEVVDKDAVVTTMMDKWQAIRQQETQVAALKEKIAQTEAAYIVEQQELEKWLEYKEIGTREDDTQIALLKQELVDMYSNYQEMAAHLERTMTKAKQEIQKLTQETLDQQKYFATEKAMAKMDTDSRQEVMDNDWLKKEVAIHKREVDTLFRKVSELEQQNLAIMEELFDCSVDDLKISRKFFLTQFQDGENLERDGILEVDLAQLSLEDKVKPLAIEANKRGRPKSATAEFIEKKVFGLPVPRTEDEDADDSDDDSIYDGNGEKAEEEDVFSNYFNIDDEDFEDYLQLGPLELKLLSVKGEKMPIHSTEKSCDEETKTGEFQDSGWSITRRHMALKTSK